MHNLQELSKQHFVSNAMSTVFYYDRVKHMWKHNGYVCRMCNAIVKAPTVAQKHSKTCKRIKVLTNEDNAPDAHLIIPRGNNTRWQPISYRILINHWLQG